MIFDSSDIEGINFSKKISASILYFDKAKSLRRKIQPYALLTF